MKETLARWRATFVAQQRVAQNSMALIAKPYVGDCAAACPRSQYLVSRTKAGRGPVVWLLAARQRCSLGPWRGSEPVGNLAATASPAAHGEAIRLSPPGPRRPAPGRCIFRRAPLRCLRTRSGRRGLQAGCCTRQTVHVYNYSSIRLSTVCAKRQSMLYIYSSSWRCTVHIVL